MSNERKEIPKFQTEDEEREFWATHNSTEYVDWDNAERVHLPNLKPSIADTPLREPDESDTLLDKGKSFWDGVIEWRNSVDWDLIDIDEDVFKDVREQSSGREGNPWDEDES